MKVGRMRYRIQLQAYEAAQDDDGFVTKEWTTVKEVWADIVPVSAREYFDSNRETTEADSKIYIRYTDGVKKFVAMWIHKVKFTQTQESYKTKGDSIEFQTPSVEGIAIGTDSKNWKTTKIFDTADAAITWINTQAGINA